MQYLAGNFDPHEYGGMLDLNGNKNITIMSHNATRKFIVRKSISSANQELYKR